MGEAQDPAPGDECRSGVCIWRAASASYLTARPSSPRRQRAPGLALSR